MYKTRSIEVLPVEKTATDKKCQTFPFIYNGLHRSKWHTSFSPYRW